MTPVDAAPGRAADLSPHAEWDAGHTGCGELVLLLSNKLAALDPGQRLRVIALDPGAVEDLPAWCRMTGHRLLEAQPPHYLIERRSTP